MRVRSGLQAGTPVSPIEIIINDEKLPLIEATKRICAKHPDMASVHHLTSYICMKIFLRWSVEQGRHEKQTPYSDAELQLMRLGPKKAATLR